MCNDLTAASNKWHVEGNLRKWSSAALEAGNRHFNQKTTPTCLLLKLKHMGYSHFCFIRQFFWVWTWCYKKTPLYLFLKRHYIIFWSLFPCPKLKRHLLRLKPQPELPLFPGTFLTHFTWEAAPSSSQSLFSHSVRVIQRVSASVCQTLPFSLCVVQHCVSLGYPP